MQSSSEILEESIDSSPYRLDSSIRRKREHRKTKRRRLNDLQQDLTHENEKLLQMYHNESEQEESIRPVPSGKNFKRFQAENMMVAADNLNLAYQRKIVPELTQTVQEFCTCERLMETQTFVSCQSSFESPRDNLESAWILQDFDDDMSVQAIDRQENIGVNCLLEQTLVPYDCDRTMVEKTSTSEHTMESAFMDWSPKKNHKPKSVVETILEDFCTSPVSSESECQDVNPEDIMPFFRFRRKKIRTYERCWTRNVHKEKLNVATRKDSNDHDNNIDSDASSELSVQEDISQVLPAVEPFDNLNTSTRIHNNLLNLSAFFTQNILDSNNAEETEKSNLSASEIVIDADAVASNASGYEAIRLLVTGILTLRAKYPISDDLISTQSNEDFNGFPSIDEDENDRDDRCAETHKRDIVCRSAPPFLQSGNLAVELSTSGYMKDNADKCSHLDSFNEDSWHHDSDFFANFQTQAILQASNTEVTKTRRKSDSTLQLPTSKRMKEQHNEMKIYIDQIDCSETKLEVNKTEALSDEMNSRSEMTISVEKILQLFEPSQSVTNKKPEKFEECDFDCMLLSEWPLDEKETDEKRETYREFDIGRDNVQKSQEEITQFGEIQKEFLEPQCSKANSKNTSHSINFSGFHTASRKEINISDEARKRITNIFAQLPDLPGEEVEKNVSAEKTAMVVNVSKNFVGNKDEKSVKKTTEINAVNVTSQKSNNMPEKNQIQIGSPLSQSTGLKHKEIRNRNLTIENRRDMVVEIAERSSDWDNEDYTSKQGSSSNFVGFQTASRKAINISEDARKKIENIFAQLPDLPGEKINKTKIAIPDRMKRLLDWPNKGQGQNEITNITTFSGFQTASRKTINISEDAHKKMSSIFAQLPELPGEKTNKSNLPSKTIEDARADKMERLSDRLNESKNNESANTQMFTGFQTASRKAINISEEALKKITSVFAQLPELPDNKAEKVQHHLNCIQIPLQKNTNSLDKIAKKDESFTGWFTASKKPINISDETKKKIGNIFSQLPDLPREMEPKKSFVENFDDITNMPLSEWIPNCDSLQPKQYNENRQEKQISNKRKLQSDDKTPKRERPHKILCRSKTMNENYTHSIDNSKQNDELKVNLSQGVNSKLIGRRNLLSLTKRRRESMHMESNVKPGCSADFVETPVKTLSPACASKSIIALHTPQGSDFNSHLPNAASTPQQLNTAGTSSPIAKSIADNLDSDFERINWENTDDSYNRNKFLDVTPKRMNSSVSNNSLKPHPSPQERIENLSSCGDPPPLPQLVESSNRSRSLGMSRRRKICSIKK